MKDDETFDNELAECISQLENPIELSRLNYNNNSCVGQGFEEKVNKSHSQGHSKIQPIATNLNQSLIGIASKIADKMTTKGPTHKIEHLHQKISNLESELTLLKNKEQLLKQRELQITKREQILAQKETRNNKIVNKSQNKENANLNKSCIVKYKPPLYKPPVKFSAVRIGRFKEIVSNLTNYSISNEIT